MPLVLSKRNTPYIGAANWWTVWDLAYPEFVSSVNTIPIKGKIMLTTLLLANLSGFHVL